jgi:hypothetical protein
MRRTLSAVALFVCALAFAPEAAACSCLGPPPPCEAFKETPAVFVAKVTEITTETVKDEGSDAKPYQVSHARLSVVQSFKGVAEKEVWMWQGTGGGDCSFVFEKGETYLLYASYDAEAKRYRTNTCTRSRPVAYAADDLDYLRGPRDDGGATRLSGTLVRLDYSDGHDQPPGLLEGVKVVAEDSQGRRSEASTDAGGFYKFKGLPAGRYKVRPELPSHLSLAYGDEGEVELPAGGCANANFLPRTDGRISGTLLDAEGRPVAEADVDLIPVEFADRVNDRGVGRFEQTDRDGKFEFTELTPGTYLLGVNIRWQPSGRQPYPRTYYPGVSSAAGARPVKLGMGEKLSDFVLRLPPRLQVRTVEGVLVWPDGKPVTQAMVEFKDTTEPIGGESFGRANVDERGRFSINALEGQEGWVHASVLVSVKDGLDVHVSVPARVVAGAGQKPLRLVIVKKAGGGVRILK